VLPGAEVVQGIARSAGLLGAEGDKPYGKLVRLLRGHPSQLQHDRDTGGVIFSTRRARDGVEVGAYHNMRLAGVETPRLGNDVR
jgi:hypothetical protein